MRRQPPSSTAVSRPGFTVVELLVVMGIIAMLMAILIPSLGRARAQAQATACASNLRQLYLAQMFYADANDGRMTPINLVLGGDNWLAKLSPFFSDSVTTRNALVQCPAAPIESINLHPDGTPMELSYGVNPYMMLPWWGGRRGVRMDTSRIILMADKGLNRDEWLMTEDGKYFAPDPLVEGGLGWRIHFFQHRGIRARRHAGVANAVMADGHVARLDQREMREDSGRWFWNQPVLELLPIPGVCCR